MSKTCFVTPPSEFLKNRVTYKYEVLVCVNYRDVFIIAISLNLNETEIVSTYLQNPALTKHNIIVFLNNKQVSLLSSPEGLMCRHGTN